MGLITSTSRTVFKGTFEPHKHWYEKALNATIHPMVNFFMNLSSERIITRYCHMHPKVNHTYLTNLLNYDLKYFQWAGADLIHVVNEFGAKKMVVIENNSCPSGQKSMPLLEDHQESGAYRHLIERSFKKLITEKKRGLPNGGLAVLYDKNEMENSGYAATIADVFEEPVHLVYFDENDSSPPARFENGVLFIQTEDQKWVPIRAAFRYVTQRPWNRIPITTKTVIFNPVIACLAGGRNKIMAAKGYDLYNTECSRNGLSINTPLTIWDVNKDEVPLWIEKLGGHGVVKIPYSNAGQGVYTITSKTELNAFMEREYPYDQFIIQSLIGNYQWSSFGGDKKLYHVGTMPTAKGETYVSDIRMMISKTDTGIRPLCVYARKARKPLKDKLDETIDSWEMLGTNLSYKLPDGSWETDTSRLLLTDRRDFNKLGIGLDELIEAFIQTILSTVAIDKMAENLINSKGKFKMKLFKSMDNDPQLISEIYVT